MTDRRNRGKDVADRLSKRFEKEKKDEPDASDKNDTADENDVSSKNSMSSQSEKSDNRVKNVKKEWNSTRVYLPDELDDPLDSEYDRLVYECGRDLDWKPKKNRHYYPVVVADGVNAIEGMNPEEFQNRVQELGLLDKP